MPEPLPRLRGRRARLRRVAALAALALFVANCANDESTNAQQQRQQPAQAQPVQAARPAGTVLTGKDALGDWTTDAPGVRRRLTVADLPKPFATESVDNGPRLVARPQHADASRATLRDEDVAVRRDAEQARVL